MPSHDREKLLALPNGERLVLKIGFGIEAHQLHDGGWDLEVTEDLKLEPEHKAKIAWARKIVASWSEQLHMLESEPGT